MNVTVSILRNGESKRLTFKEEGGGGSCLAQALPSKSFALGIHQPPGSRPPGREGSARASGTNVTGLFHKWSKMMRVCVARRPFMLPGRLRRIMSLSCLQPFLECPLRSPVPRTWGGLTRTRTDPGFAVSEPAATGSPSCQPGSVL